MAKYAIFFSYSSDAWARMIRSPGDRTAAARLLARSMGGSLECMYWMFGAHDGLAIVDTLDAVSVAAISVATGSSGSFKHVETHELLTQEQLGEVLARARDAAQVFQAPGEQG